MASKGYPLADLLRVRNLREEEAERHLSEARGRLRECEELRSRESQELERYRSWRPKEEERRYADILGQQLSPEGLTAFRQELAGLAEGETRRELSLAEADEKVREKERELEEAQKVMREARQATHKLEEHRTRWEQERKKEEERLSDLELEETHRPAPVSDE